jgi:hypothetical protein
MKKRKSGKRNDKPPNDSVRNDWMSIKESEDPM